VEEKATRWGFLHDILGLETSNGVNYRGSEFPVSVIEACKPGWLLRKDWARIERGEFFSNNREGKGGGDTMDNKLSINELR
jgi:hypothetical protein